MSIKNREFSYLRTYKEPLNCPRPSTSVENALQISSLMQNKPNSPIVQMNVNNLTTMNYTIFTSLTKVKNKPNSNPIATRFGCGQAMRKSRSLSNFGLTKRVKKGIIKFSKTMFWGLKLPKNSRYRMKIFNG